MAKRRRCKDKLVHHEHLWGPGMSSASAIAAYTSPGGSIGFKLPLYWCLGVEKEPSDD